jgi:hypothetical protein
LFRNGAALFFDFFDNMVLHALYVLFAVA